MTPNAQGPFPSRLIVVKIAYDREADVWYVDQSDIPGLRAEGKTADALMERIPGILRELIEENGWAGAADRTEIPVEIIASTSARVRLNEAA